MGPLPPEAQDISRASSFYKEAVRNLQYWQYGQTFFTCQLFTLMMKADHNNFKKLATGFPLEAKALYDWFHAKDPQAFFDEVLKGPE